MSRAHHIALLKRYVASAEPTERIALDVIASFNRDLDAMGCARTYAEYTLGPARLVVAHLGSMRRFIERAEHNEVNADHLERAAEAAASLMGDREQAA